MFPVGSALGPVIGGALRQVFRWASVFLIAVPVMRCCSSPGRCWWRSTAPRRRTRSTW
ncbi:hypothetical protein [Pseudonocardia sp. McavD-2-B]